MAGSIVFRSGSSWDVGSLAFREALQVLVEQHELPKDANEHLRLAAEFGFLVLGDLPAREREHFAEVLATDTFAAELISRFQTVLDFIESDASVDDLVQRARREPTLPSWIWCNRENVIVQGLPASRLAEATGLKTTVVLWRDQEDDTLRFDFTQDDLDVYIDLNMALQAPADSFDFEDARLTLRSRGHHDAAQLDALRAELIRARAAISN